MQKGSKTGRSKIKLQNCEKEEVCLWGKERRM